MITFLLAEAELELVPAELAAHPKVLARAKRRRRAPEQLLLDQAADHDAMHALEGADRRGRPDIAQIWSLLVMDSPLVKRGLARVLIHTRHDELIRIRPDTRLPRNQAKMYQLFEDLFRQAEVPRGAPLLTLERGRDLQSVMAAEARGAKVLLDVGGELGRSSWFAEHAREGDMTIVMGGFPRGSFRQAQRAWFDHVVRVHDEEITVWSALVPVLAGCEDGALAGKG